MQATADGEFYPEKSLDKNFTIPRRNMPSETNMPVRGNSRQKTNQIETPLANSYYNYPYDPRAASSYYQYYQGFGNMPGQGSQQRGLFGFTAPPPPPPPGDGVEPIKRNIFNTLKDFKEKPKVYGKNIYGGIRENYGDQGHGNEGYNEQRTNRRYDNQGHKNQGFNSGGVSNEREFGNELFSRERCNDRQSSQRGSNGNRHDYTNQNFSKKIFNRQQNKTLEKRPVHELSVQQTVPDLLDESLPKDLKLLFQPLFCKLCSAQLSSNQAAKMHYKSKNHEKKIRKWLVEWSEKTGEPLPMRAVATNTKKDEGAEKNPAWFHCEVCDLELTGRLHAESHYMGKNHQKALLGYKAPSGQGYYKDGKWVRVKGQKSKSYDFEKGQDNFGMEFKKAQQETKEVDADSGEPPAKKKKESGGPPSKFHCEVCGVNTTCQDQLDNHYRGQKHLKKLKQLGLESSAEHGKNTETSGTTTVPVTPEPPADVDMNLSVYRTPSGDYYCPTCNLTANSEPQFIQHMRSKGHARKAAQKKVKSGN